MTSLKLHAAIAASFLALAPVSASAEIVGKVGVDWTGNDILVDAVPDPEVSGVTCHVTYFDRSVIDRLKNGNWFEDPSNNSIACRQTGPIEIGNISLSEGGEEVFRAGLSLIWKKLVVDRILRQEERHADLSHSFARIDQRFGENGDFDHSAVRPECYLEERQA